MGGGMVMGFFKVNGDSGDFSPNINIGVRDIGVGDPKGFPIRKRVVHPVLDFLDQVQKEMLTLILGYKFVLKLLKIAEAYPELVIRDWVTSAIHKIYF